MTTSGQSYVCSFCDGMRMSEVMDFGEVALAGAFIKPEQFESERKYRLRLYVCEDCHAVQVIDKIPPEVMFQDYFYFSSAIGTLRNHFYVYAEEITSRFIKPAEATVLEFGCMGRVKSIKRNVHVTTFKY